MNKDLEIVKTCLSYLEKRAPAYFKYWTAGEDIPGNGEIKSYCDVVYTLLMLDFPIELSPIAIVKFFQLVNSKFSLYGARSVGGTSCSLSCHNTAYVTGCVRILRHKYPDICNNLSISCDWEFERILNEGVPRYPKKYKFHPWRVSHWIGGVPAISLNIYRETGNEEFLILTNSILDSLETTSLNEKGLIDLGGSAAFNAVFRNLYRLRHDPLVGDIGGIAHVIWVYHSLDRQFPFGETLVSTALKIIMSKASFIEQVPYCLDFDFLQLLRMFKSEIPVSPFGQVERRVMEYKINMENYIKSSGLSDTRFSLHKLPGALCAISECELFIDGRSKAVDVIKVAGWI